MKVIIHYSLLFLLFAAVSSCNKDHFDIVILNGIIHEGMGNPPVKADIGILDGRIEKIGEGLETKGARILDAQDKVIAPGFIDMHTHCDGEVLQPGMNSVLNYLTQGVTTVVTGNCGSGTHEVESFYRRLDSIGTGPNIVHLVGHNRIRGLAMGMEDREPSDEEMKKMKELLESGLLAGAAGMSTGLYYTPGAYSKTDEVVELTKLVHEYGGFYATHMRDESNFTVGLEAAVKEAITIGKETGARIQISHIKALGKPVWGLSPHICDLISDARSAGLNVFADQYPYEASSTGLIGAIVPVWARSGGNLEKNLKDAAVLPGLKKELAANIDRRGGPGSLVIVSYPNDPRFTGKSLAEISSMLGKPPVETAIFLILDGRPPVISFNMQSSDVEHFMKQDYVMTSSDGHIEVPGESVPHPRCYGSFPRKIRKYVMEDKLISMEHAIRAATSQPAGMIGLMDRGILKEGYVADIVVFDPESLNDNATFADPHQYSSGITHLLVNGELVIRNGEYLNNLPGKALRLN